MRRSASLARALRLLQPQTGGALAAGPPLLPAAALACLAGGSSHGRWHDWQGRQASGPGASSVRHFSIGGASQQREQEPSAEQLQGHLWGGDLSEPASAAGFGNAASAAAPAAASVATAVDPTAALASTLAAPAAADTLSAVVAAAEADALAAAAEGTWLPTQWLQSALLGVHNTTGLPWWGTIMLTTLGVRLATLPVMLAQVKNTHRLSQARPEIEALLEHLKEEQARGNQNATAEYQARVMEVWRKYDCNPMKSIASLFVQFPVFIGFFSALRAFAAHKVPSMTTGGALWFADLTAPDPHYLLPVLAGLTFLATVELGAADGMEGQPEKTKQRMKNVMRFVSVAIIPMTADLPAGVFMYWMASNMFSLGQTLVLKNKAVRQLVGLPDLKRGAAAAAAQSGVGKPVQTFKTKPQKRSADAGQQPPSS